MIGPAEVWNNLLGYENAWINTVCPCQSIDVACQALDPVSSSSHWDETIESTANKHIKCCILSRTIPIIVVSTFHSCCFARDLPFPKRAVMNTSISYEKVQRINRYEQSIKNLSLFLKGAHHLQENAAQECKRWLRSSVLTTEFFLAHRFYILMV